MGGGGEGGAGGLMVGGAVYEGGLVEAFFGCWCFAWSCTGTDLRASYDGCLKYCPNISVHWPKSH